MRKRRNPDDCREYPVMLPRNVLHRPTIVRCQGLLLGGFVVLQLVYLVAANLLPLFPQHVATTGELTDDFTFPGRTFKSDYLQTPLESANAVTRKYGEATGQMQNWALFAPGIARQATFPVVELEWNYGQTPRLLKLTSEFEPADPRHFARFDLSRSRIFNYEFRITQSLWFCTNESLADSPELWQEWLAHRAARQRRSLHAYLRSKVWSHAKEHPAEPLPTAAVLYVRCYPIAPPGSAAENEPPQDRPLVRLNSSRRKLSELPGEFGHAGELEVFNPVKKQFQRLEARDE
jgi:hypothetical protein